MRVTSVAGFGVEDHVSKTWRDEQGTRLSGRPAAAAIGAAGVPRAGLLAPSIADGPVRTSSTQQRLEIF
jgi:hypothetical protein